MDNYLELGTKIKARLIERLGQGVRGVYALGGMLDLIEGRVETPAVYVLFDKEITGSVASREQIVQQVWLVLLAVRNFGAEDMLEEAGRLLANINSALMGWSPGPGYDVLAKRSSPSTEYDGTNNIFALAFSCRMVVKGQG